MRGVWVSGQARIFHRVLRRLLPVLASLAFLNFATIHAVPSVKKPMDEIVTKARSNTAADRLARSLPWQTCTLKGVVRDSTGAPLPQVTIFLHPALPPAVSDAKGAFTIDLAPLDRDYDLYGASPDGRSAAVVHLKGGTSTAAIALKSTRDMKGKAITSGGLPAANLSFIFCPLINGMPIPGRNKITTAPNGTFTAPALIPGAAYSAIWSSSGMENRDYDSGSATVDLAKLKAGAPIRLEVKQFVNALMGRAVDGKGRPVPDAQIAVKSPGMQPQEARRKTVLTDREGNFTLERLAGGKVTLRVYHPRFKSLEIETPSDAIDCTITLSPKNDRNVYTISTLDERDKPVPNAPLQITLGNFTQAQGNYAVQNQTLRTDARGGAEYALNVSPTSGTFTITARVCCDAPDYDLAFARLPLDEDGKVKLLLRRGGEHWSGRVATPSGKPVSGANVSIVGIRMAEGQDEVALDPRPELKALTDAEGRFAFPRISRYCDISLEIAAAGFFRFGTWLNGSGKADQAGLATGPTVLTLKPGNAIMGRVINKTTGRPQPRGQVQCASKSSGGVGAINEDGSFTIPNLQPDEYEVFFTPTDDADRTLVTVAVPRVTAGSDAALRLNLEVEEGVLVRGRLIDPATGKPLASVSELSVKQGESRATVAGGEVKEDGQWEMVLAPGTYTLIYYNSELQRLVEITAPLVIEKGKRYDHLLIEAK